jgi:dynein heavy chain
MRSELQRIYYVTPALFIRFVTFYQALLDERQMKHRRSKARLETGVQKLIQLDQVLPLLEEATAQLKGLSRSDVAEVRQYSDPHIMVRTVMEAVCLLAEVDPTWKSAVSLVSDPMFISRISSKYGEGRHVPLAILNKIQPYVEENTTFQPEAVGRVSRAAKSLCIWATVLYKFEVTYRTVEPKQLAVAEAKAALKAAKDALQAKQDELARIEAALAALRQKYEESVAKRAKLAAQIDETEVKLGRAAKLTVGLADEQVRWGEQVEAMNESVIFIPGDSFLCAAVLIYFSPFPALYRAPLQEAIFAKITAAGIQMSAEFDFMRSMVDESVVRDWNTIGLPNDSTSIENALIITCAPKSALIIDPQNQATQWIKRMEEARQLTCLKRNSGNFMRSMENAIRLGIPVLLEDVAETVDPALDSLLMRKTYKQDGKEMVRIGDKAVDIDEKFRLYVTTKLTNPHFMPDMFVKVSIVNFIVTQAALEAQQLSQVVSLERPELESQKHELVMSIAADKKVLVDIEDKLLELLRNAGEKILDDEVLIVTIEEAKAKSLEVKERVRVSEETEIEINRLRLEYRPVAIRSALLFFVTGDMAQIDPMYQYSLEFFRDLVQTVISNAPRSDDRLGTLISRITYSTYLTVSRGLFETHRSLFAFMMCAAIMRNEDTL